MTIAIDLLTSDKHEEYEELLKSAQYSLLYSSVRFCEFLKTVLTDSESKYLGAFENGKLVGALPAFLFRNSRFGNILNSLPFFGSYGGVTLAPRVSHRDRIKIQLIEAFHSLSREEAVVASTIISNPLHSDREFYDNCSGATLHDDRIGQITPLPPPDPKETLADRLIVGFHRKTRNHIRKGQKSGFAVERTNSPEAFGALASMHRQNMEAIGGRVKEQSVFDAIRATFQFPDDYVVYTAAADGQIVAALLVFFFNRTAEYYTPATEEGFRVYQPTSLLIFEAMQDAVRRGCRYWNWGGTWLSQKGIYDFKARWGTRDYPYRYYVREYGGADRLRACRPEELASEYPYYYVIPIRT
jgi:hypothetical protein